MILQWLLVDAPKVIAQVSLELDALLENIGEVDEETRAHVALQFLDLFLINRNVIPHEQIAIFQQASTADFLLSIAKLFITLVQGDKITNASLTGRLVDMSLFVR